MDESTLNKPVCEIMNSPVRTIDYTTSLPDAARILCRDDIGSLVIEDDDVEGILTESDIVRAVGAEHDPDQTTVGQLMTTTVLSVDAETSVEMACERMRTNDVKKLPVTENGDVVGMVTTTDVTHSLVPDLDEVISSFL
jgi:CBS domain-containing protein